MWQALPGTASSRPPRFRASIFQSASEACLSILSQRQAYSSDAISDLERRSRLRPEERGWLAQCLAHALVMPRIPYASQIIAALERLFPRCIPSDQTQIRRTLEAALSNPDSGVRLRAQQFLQMFPPRPDRPRR